MGLNHNKKRNVGLLREFFSKHIANNIIKNDKQSIIKAKNLWFKYNNDTEIKKELKVVTSLLESKFNNKEMAYEHIKKLKKFCQTISESKLEFEKTNLLREINNKISDKEFFNRNIDNYVDMATIQIVVNSWIKNDDVIDNNISKLEDKILDYICKPKLEENKQKDILRYIQGDKEANVDKLIIKIMNEKFNKKFSSQLTEDQKSILRDYVFEKNNNSLKEKIENLRDVALELIDKETKKTDINKLDKDRLQEIRNLIINDYYEVENLNESNIVFYMSISKLNEELKEER